MFKYFSAVFCLLFALGVNAQTFADQLISSGPCEPIVSVTCPSGVINPNNAVDANPDNFATLRTTIGLSLLESTAFIEVGFSELGAPGSEVGAIIQPSSGGLNIDLVDNIALVVFNENDQEVVRREDISLTDVGLLGGQDKKQILRIATPLGNYKIKKVRLEITGVLNVSQDLSVYGIFHNESCPAILADGVVNFLSTNNPGNAVDGDTATFATLSIPIGLGNSAALEVSFSQPALPGDYIGFEISRNNTILSLSLLENLNIILFDEDGNELQRENTFSTADLIALDELGGVLGPVLGVGGGTNPKQIIGFTSSSNLPANIASATIQLQPTIGLLVDMNIHAAFYYSSLRGIEVTADRVGVIDGQPVTLTASEGYDSYSWSDGQSGRVITVTEPGTYTVTASRFDGCEIKGTELVRDLDCGRNGRIFADSVHSFGNCDPMVPLVCPSGVENPGFAVDSDPNSFARMVSSLGVSLIESTSFLDLSFSTRGDAGSDVSFIVEPLNENLNLDVVDDLRIIIYDEDGNEVLRQENALTANVGLLSGGTGKTVITVRTPVGNYKIRRARIEMEGTVNLIQDLAIHGMYIDCACPPVAATSVISSVNATDTEKAVDSDNSNYAILSTPISLGTPLSIELGFDNPASAGDYVAFQIAPDQDLLSLGLVENINLYAYDENGTEVASYTDFKLADLVAAEQLGGALGGLLGVGNGGGTEPYIVGFQLPAGTYQVSSVKIEYVALVGLLQSLRVYNAFYISQLQGVAITGSEVTSCEGQDVTLTAPSGYTSYEWSTGETTQEIVVDKPGVYYVTISRADGCALSGAYFLEDNTFAVNLDVVEPDCQTSNGSATATAAGGSGTYSYLWSTGATTSTVSDIPSGIYTVSITDQILGCIADRTVLVSDNGAEDFTGYVRHADCGQANGAIFLTVKEGSTIQWATGETSPILRNLAAGTYIVIVTDANGCKKIKEFRVLDRADFNLSAEVQDSDCGSDNGSIDLFVGVGGQYAYLWSNGARTEDLTDLAPGVYSVIVTDVFTGCEDILYATVSDDGSASVTLDDSKEETCLLAADGFIEINISSPLSETTILWSNGETTPRIENLGSGIYTVEVTNGFGCKAVRLYELIARDSLSADVSTTPSFCSEPFTGTVSTEVMGGRTPFTYSWNTGETTDTLADVAPATYTLTVTDFNGCVETFEAVVGKDSSDPSCGNEPEPEPCDDCDDGEGAEVLTPNGDGMNDVWKTTFHEKYPENTVEIFSRDGALVYEKKNYQDDWDGTFRETNELLPEGTYFWVFTPKNSDKEFRGFVVLKY